MSTILPPLPTTEPDAPVDHDSLAARQARTALRSSNRVIACQRALLDTVVGSFSDLWGQPIKVKQSDGTTVADPSQRRNEDNLSPVDVLAAYGTSAAAKLAAYHLIIADAIQLGATNGTRPGTGEDMTVAPVGWTLTPQSDGTVVASYTAPVTPPAPATTQSN